MNRRSTKSGDNSTLLCEDAEGITLSPTSVDTQIDSLLTSFENAAAEVDDDNLIVPEGIFIRPLLAMLFEGEDDVDDDNDEDITSNADVKNVEPAVPQTPNLNIDKFAQQVSMLIETYTKRLDVEVVIFNRSLAYIKNYYGESVARRLKEILIKEYGIDLFDDVQDDVSAVAPLTPGAGPI